MDVSWDQKSNTWIISLRRDPLHHIVNLSSKSEQTENFLLELRPIKDSILYKIKIHNATICDPNMIWNGIVLLNFLVQSFLDINQIPKDFCFFELILKLKENH